MTRDYNKQRRDDMRPPSRNQPPGRPGDKSFQRPARPRLNRETVDRAWESGANTQHADYRTRSSSGGYRQSSRNNQSPGYSSNQNGRRPYGNRQEPDRGRTPYGNHGNTGLRSSSFDADRRGFDDQRGNDRRNYAGGPSRNEAARPGFRDNRHPRPYEQRFRDNEQGRGYQRRDPGSYDRQPGGFDGRSPRNFEQKRGDRPPYQRPDTQNPRWQSRPAARRDNSYGKQQTFNERDRQGAQFEGDYERFDSHEDRKGFSARPTRGNGTADTSRPQSKAEEPPVTRLPDGRVLKGPRPAQRKNAQFWTDIAQETGDLIGQANPVTASPEEQAVEAVEDTSTQEKESAKAQRKPRTRAASAVKRDKKPAGKKSAAKPRSTGPKPSQRGFKWPAP